MKNIKGRMDEKILVCVNYGKNGERLIRRGVKLASIMNCPVYVLTIDPLPYDEFSAERVGYIDAWKELCDELGVDRFIVRDNEKRPVEKVIAEVAHQLNITQIIIGQPVQSRWEEITKGSIANAIMQEISFVDVHLVSISRVLKSDVDTEFERGVRAFLKKDGDDYRITFTRSKENLYEGIFYKEIGTDFNNGIFRYISKEGKPRQVHITDDIAVSAIDEAPNVKIEK